VTIYCIATKFGIYQDAPLSRLSVYQISRQSDNAFVFYSNFHTFTKRKRNKKNEETLPTFEGSYLGNTWLDLVEINLK